MTSVQEYKFGCHLVVNENIVLSRIFLGIETCRYYESILFYLYLLFLVQSKAKAEKNQAMEQSMSENSCQLCAVEKLTFEPPPIYCTPCGARIKRNAMYYTIGTGDTRHYFCIPCYNEARGDTIIADGTAIPKARLEKKKNDEETEEWVHNI